MSVLSFPRIYFQGFMEWDPCTFNNNDWQEFPTYDGVNATLNWPFLATQNITPQNFPTTFRPWAITLQPDCVDQPNGSRIPAEWNMFGTHGVTFVQYPEGGFATTITGGSFGPTTPVTSDPLIGGPVSILGDRGSGPGRLVDTNPASFWSSQIYFQSMAFGSGDCVIRGPRHFRMHSRWLDLSRIYNANSALTQPAASVGCCFQTCIPFAEVTWPAASAGSPLAAALQQAASTGSAIGIMVRFTAYVNVYFRNGIFNGYQQQPRSYEELAKALAEGWASYNANGSTDGFFSNPCYSHIVGTLGVWNADEVGTVPVGRFLAAASMVAPQAGGTAKTLVEKGRALFKTSAAAETAPAPQAKARGHELAAVASAAPPAVALGPAVVQVDYDAELISIDLNSTIPELGTAGEWPSDLEKADFGTIDVGVISNGTFTSVAQIAYDQYSRAAYEASAGIVDIAFPSAGTAALLQSGALALQVTQGDAAQTALIEQQFSAQTDSRGIYVDQGSQASFAIGVYDFGAISPNTNVLIAQYDQSLSLVPASAAPLVYFTAGQAATVTSGGVTTNVTIVTSDAQGVATAAIAAANPGFAVLAFFPYSGTTLPVPPLALLGPNAPIYGSITYAFYTTVRVLPFDNALPEEFVRQWNATQNPAWAWEFIYNEILSVYDMLFNVMLGIVNLGSQSADVGSIGYIWPVISAAAAEESTLAMPITRDMSAGKRLTLQLWIYLVANQYNVPNFSIYSIPQGWAPPATAQTQRPAHGGAHRR
jgi:hypothetical protein